MINKRQAAEVVPEVVCETLEGMAFMALSQSGAPEDGPRGAWLWAEVAVHAPFSGRVRIACPQPLALEMTRTMFGHLSEAQAVRAVADALGEVANTIAGKLVAGLTCDTEMMQLGLPESGEGLPPAEKAGTFWFMTEELQPFRVEAGMEAP